MWYNVAGYSVATITGVMRVMSNHHWAIDVLFGAGIGIISVDLGYFLGNF
jgi:membrane-associated phospholipid phosphatase